MTTRYELEAWLGPALDQLTLDQVDRIAAESGRIDARYPDPDEQDLRDAALSAVVQYLLGETTLDDAGRALDRARLDLERARAVAWQLASMATEDGVSEVQAAERARIDRMQLRRVLGKQ